MEEEMMLLETTGDSSEEISSSTPTLIAPVSEPIELIDPAEVIEPVELIDPAVTLEPGEIIDPAVTLEPVEIIDPAVTLDIVSGTAPELFPPEIAFTDVVDAAPATVSFEVEDFTGDDATATITLEEVAEGVKVTVDGLSTPGDLRGLFFNLSNPSLLDGLLVNGTEVTSSVFGPDNGVNQISGDANVTPASFDGGVEIGTPGIGADDISSSTFILSHESTQLTLSQFLGQEFGLRVTSVGENREGSSKLQGVAPEVIALSVPGEVVEGDETDEVLVGTDGDDSIAGNGGDDTCIGEAGTDVIVGGSGDDFVSGNEGEDTCVGGAGEDEIFGGQGDDAATGGEGNDMVSGDLGDDFASGNEGDDTCLGGAGEDEVFGGQGDDSASGGEGNDMVSGDLGDDTCMGDAGDDSVMGGEGNDMAMGGEGNDVVMGDAGDDTCAGDAGDDSIMGGVGDDSCVGGAGNDMVMGEDGNDTLEAVEGDNTLDGGAGNDMVMAGSGNDMIMGGSGDDTFMGGTGDHTCVGGTGSDSFVLAPGGGQGMIEDFEVGSDQFVLDGGLTFQSLSFVQVNVNVEIQVNNQVMVTVANANAEELGQASNFVDVEGQPIEEDDDTPSTGTLQPGENNTFNLPAGGSQVLDFSQLSFSSSVASTIDIVYTLESLPTNGTLYFNGEAVTTAGFTFTQADINLNLISFEAEAGVEGSAPAGFQFSVTDGITTLINQTFEISVFQTTGFTITPGVPFTGSPLDDDIEGSSGDDDIDGGSGNDKVKGGKGNDKIKGGRGNDALSGGSGDDDLSGGSGDDRLSGGSGKNKLKGGSGKDKFSFKKKSKGAETLDEADVILDFNVDDDFLEFDIASFGNITIENFVSINITSSTTSVGNASLLVFDQSFTSLIDVQARFEELEVGDRPVFCLYDDASTGGSVLVFSFGSRVEIVATFAFSVNLTVNNFLFTGTPLEIPGGTAGDDIVDFGTFPVPISFDGLAGNDSIVGSEFDDSLLGGAGDDAIDGGSGDDEIDGGDGNDSCVGGEGDDSCLGGAGNDTLSGGAGIDTLAGGAGADVISYASTSEGGDYIVGFVSGEDQLLFSTTEFANIGSADFEGVSVSGTSVDITGAELLVFEGTFASLSDVDTEFSGLQSTGPVFCVIPDGEGGSTLLFDADGFNNGASAVEVAYLEGVTTIETTDFLFSGSGADFGSVPEGMAPVDTESGPNFSGASAPVIFDYSSFSGPLDIVGSDFDDNFTGTELGDSFTGGSGADILTGGSGTDLFIYNSTTEGIDTIVDFSSGVDKLQFAGGSFGSLSGALTVNNYFDFSSSTPGVAELGLGSSPAFFLATDGADPGLYFDPTGTSVTSDFTQIAVFPTATSELPAMPDFTFI